VDEVLDGFSIKGVAQMGGGNTAGIGTEHSQPFEQSLKQRKRDTKFTVAVAVAINAIF
jgi:hypothetical protein